MFGTAIWKLGGSSAKNITPEMISRLCSNIRNWNSTQLYQTNTRGRFQNSFGCDYLRHALPLFIGQCVENQDEKEQSGYSTEHLSKRRRDSLQNKVHFQVLKLYIARRIKAHNEVISRTQAPHTHIQPAQYGFWFIESREKKVDMVFLK